MVNSNFRAVEDVRHKA